MSALSSTLRDLRDELNSNVVSTGSSDATVDLIEAELESSASKTTSKSRVFFNSSSEERQVDDPIIPPAVLSKKPETPETFDFDKKSDVSALVVGSELRKGYVKGKKLIPVLQGVNLTVRKGELLAVVGQSGSGKSTLLHLMGTLDVPDSGTIHFDGQRIDNLPSAQRDVLRNRFIGMIFQFYHLIPEMTTLENVLAPLMIRESILGYYRNRSEYVARAKELLDLVGLSHRLRHRPNELSGGEMQRASIARALITNPRVLLADEPTGNLDSKASIGVLELLRELNQEKNLTIVMVTHDMSQAKDADRAVRIVDGWVVPE
ncbi:MAG: ABC transporter ATP-binding protein [Thermoguttaceae bacterium]|nr:ABC transporter ATP-binding protein [Thermoguttaceae bacterium]